MIIRNAHRNDAAQLVYLLDQLGYTMTLTQVQQKMAAYERREGHAIFVASEKAEEESLLLGFITLTSYECFVFEGACMHIESLIVDHAHRGKGIGKKLIAAAERFALDQNCSMVELLTRNHRRKDGTHTFYKNLGYKDQVGLDISYFSKEIKSD